MNPVQSISDKKTKNKSSNNSVNGVTSLTQNAPAASVTTISSYNDDTILENQQGYASQVSDGDLFLDDLDISDIANLRFLPDESVDELLERAEKDIRQRVVIEVFPDYLTEEETALFNDKLEEDENSFDELMEKIVNDYPEIEDEIKVISRKYKKDLLTETVKELMDIRLLVDERLAKAKKCLSDGDFKCVFDIVSKEQDTAVVV